jgi:hypothetical protein
MSMSLVYWVVFLLSVIFWTWSVWPNFGKPAASSIVLFILLLLLGWRVFGPPIHS